MAIQDRRNSCGTSLLGSAVGWWWRSANPKVESSSPSPGAHVSLEPLCGKGFRLHDFIDRFGEPDRLEPLARRGSAQDRHRGEAEFSRRSAQKRRTDSPMVRARKSQCDPDREGRARQSDRCRHACQRPRSPGLVRDAGMPWPLAAIEEWIGRVCVVRQSADCRWFQHPDHYLPSLGLSFVIDTRLDSCIDSAR